MAAKAQTRAASLTGGVRLAPRPAARPPMVGRVPSSDATTKCGATPKGLPVSVSTYDDDVKEKSRKYRRTVSFAVR